MSRSSIVLHCGARQVERSELALVEVPPATRSWTPVAHSRVVDRVLETLGDAGYNVARESYGLSRTGGQMFAAFDLHSELSDGAALSIGVRNSVDQSLSLGFCAGSRVFVCDNLSFSGDLNVNRKHTRFGVDRFEEAVSYAVKDLAQFREQEARRIGGMRRKALDPTLADALILRAFETGVVGARCLPEVIRQWREPSFDWGPAGTAWHLYNACTHALKPVERRNPREFSRSTMRVLGLIGPHCEGYDSADLIQDGPAPGDDLPEVIEASFEVLS